LELKQNLISAIFLNNFINSSTFPDELKIAVNSMIGSAANRKWGNIL
jgi:hypothetical protein